MNIIDHPTHRDDPRQLLLVPDVDVRCVGCGRLLRSEASRQRRYGLKCWHKRTRESNGDTDETSVGEQ